MRYSKIIVLMVAVLSCCLSAFPTSHAATIRATDPCIVNGYVPEANHVSQLANNSIMFGTMLCIETDCGAYTISIDDKPPLRVENNQQLVLNVSENTRNILVEFDDGHNMTWVNLQFWPSNMYSGLMSEYQNNLFDDDGEFISNKELRTHDFFVALVTVIITWLVSLMIVDRITGHVIERMVGREVVD